MVLCRDRRAVERARLGIERVLGRLKLQLHPEKTRLVCLWDGQEGFDFLGFHHQKAEPHRRRGVYHPFHWPSQKAEKSIRRKVRELTTQRFRLRDPLVAFVTDLNLRIRGWAAYYGYGTASWRFATLDSYIWERLVLFLNSKYRRRHQRRIGKYTYPWLQAQGLLSLTQAVQRRQANAAGEGHRRAV